MTILANHSLSIRPEKPGYRTKGKVIRRGTNYIVLEDANNNLHKSWIWDCIPIAANKDVLVREYNLDVDYGFKAVSEIKEEPNDNPSSVENL